MKKIAALMLCSIMTLSLAACGGGGGTGGNGGGGNSGAQVSGEIIDTGVFSALLPDGWYNYPVTDMWSENDELDPDALRFCKNMQSEEELFYTAYLQINRYDADAYILDMRDMYDDVMDVDFTIDGVQWTGFTGMYGDYENFIIQASKDGVIFYVSGVMNGEKSSFTLDDPEVQAILGSCTLD